MLKNNIFRFLFVLTLTSFFLRFYGVLNNAPYWVDEFSSAQQAIMLHKFGFSIFTNTSLGADLHNVLTHTLIASSFSVFGHHEWVARIPFVLIGSLVPVLVFFVARSVYSLQVAISASMLTTFSYFLITWSRQARGYVLQQALVLISIYLYLKLLNSGSKKIAFWFFAVLVLGILTHAMFFILIATFALHFFFFKRRLFLSKILRNKASYIVLLLSIYCLHFEGFFEIIKKVVLANVLKTQNLWYYHSFLWREYGLITFLAVIGLGLGYSKNKQVTTLFFLYILFQLLCISFLWPPYASRYLLPIIPLMFMTAAYGIDYLSKGLIFTRNKERKKILIFSLPIIITLFIIVNGNKFVVKPKQFYSVNHDFREIAIVDYAKVYNVIKTKGQLEQKQTAVIDTWHDRLFWYLGSDFPHPFLFRWINEPGLVNGLAKTTDYKINEKGDKMILKASNLGFVGELSDLKKISMIYPRGFIYIDDSSLPKDVIQYAERHFKKELYLDHYPLDDNPYSIWPATLYSWGIK